jgi:hypothetical protein
MTMHGQTIIEQSGVTRVSLKLWKLTRPLFSTFTDAYCTFRSGFRRYQLEEETRRGDYTPIGQDRPRLILVDDSGAELWLSGCAAGYTGEGAAGTGYVLQTEGFDPGHVDLVPFSDRLHVRKGRAEPQLHVRRDERYEIVAGTWSRHITDLTDSGYFKDVEAA